MDWKQIKPQHYHVEPVEHICITNLVKLNDYDRLYENQNNLQHPCWIEFCEKNNTTVQLKEKIVDLDFSNDVMCLWFFKERSDGTASYVHLDGKQIEYYPNKFLISKSKNIKLVTTTRKYIRNPVVQVDIDLKTYNNIVAPFQK